jgi:16S rRNA processing protein RimM
MSAAAPDAAPDAAPAWPADAVEVGRITGAWGVKGWIKVEPYAADPQALFGTKCWWLRPAVGAPRPGVPSLPALLRVTQMREQGDAIVAAVQDLTDRDAATALRGARVFVPRSSFPSAGAGEFYWVDLIGLAVVNREGVALGEVAGLLDTGAHSVLRVRPVDGAAGEGGGAGGAERLIPFVDAYIDRVDLEGRLIVADWGLDY